MKIAFMISTIGFGGAERVITNLANQFAIKEDYEVYIIVKYISEKEYKLHHKVKRIDLNHKNNKLFDIYKNITFIRRFCNEKKIDILVSFMAASNIKAIIATQGTKTKCLVSVRDDPDREYGSFILKILARNLFLFADGVVFQTKNEAEWFSDKIRARSAIIPNPISDKFYLTDSEYDSIKIRNYIVAIGRLEKQKNHRLLIEAFKIIKNNYPNEKLIIYGQGSLQHDLERLINYYELNENIKLAGEVDGIENYIKKAKLFVMSSDHEGLPNAMLESMALGLPVICTDCPAGGPREFINDGVDGLLVKVGDVDGLAQAMNKILKNPEMGHYLGWNARKKSIAFNEKIVFKKWENFIRACLMV